MTDKLAEADGKLYNTLQSEPLTEKDVTVATDAKDDVISVPADGSVDVTVTITLSDAARTCFAETFPNGNFIEGFVELTEIREDAFRFDDVQDEQSFYFDPVYWAYNRAPQITAGTSATTFSPANDCTRAEVVRFLWNAAGQPAPTADVGGGVLDAPLSNPFEDVKETDWFYEAVLWAAANKITAGTTPTTIIAVSNIANSLFAKFPFPDRFII